MARLGCHGAGRCRGIDEDVRQWLRRARRRRRRHGRAAGTGGRLGPSASGSAAAGRLRPEPRAAAASRLWPSRDVSAAAAACERRPHDVHQLSVGSIRWRTEFEERIKVSKGGDSQAIFVLGLRRVHRRLRRRSPVRCRHVRAEQPGLLRRPGIIPISSSRMLWEQR